MAGVRAGELTRQRVDGIQRTRIVAAVVQVVGEHGVQGMSVARVVSRAGVSRRTFYELFADAEECFLAAFDHSVERIAAAVVPAYEAGRRTPGSHGWQDRVRAALLALLCHLDEDPSHGRLVIVDALAAGPRAVERRARLQARLVEAVDEGRRHAKAGSVASPITAEGVVGAVCSVLHTRLHKPDPRPFVHLTNPLMSIVLLPYLGPAATRAELRRPDPPTPPKAASQDTNGDLLTQLGMRITYRTVRVLLAVDELPGASNRTIGKHSGVEDQGQISKLLRRLEGLGLIANDGPAEPGSRNAWRLTERGEEVKRLVA